MPSAIEAEALLEAPKVTGPQGLNAMYGAENPRDCVSGKVHSLVNR